MVLFIRSFEFDCGALLNQSHRCDEISRTSPEEPPRHARRVRPKLGRPHRRDHRLPRHLPRRLPDHAHEYRDRFSHRRHFAPAQTPAGLRHPLRRGENPRRPRVHQRRRRPRPQRSALFPRAAPITPIARSCYIFVGLDLGRCLRRGPANAARTKVRPYGERASGD